MKKYISKSFSVLLVVAFILFLIYLLVPELSSITEKNTAITKFFTFNLINFVFIWLNLSALILSIFLLFIKFFKLISPSYFYKYLLFFRWLMSLVLRYSYILCFTFSMLICMNDVQISIFATIISFVALFNSFFPKRPTEFPDIRKRISDFFDIRVEETKETKTGNSLIDSILNFFGLEYKVVKQTREDHQEEK